MITVMEKGALASLPPRLQSRLRALARKYHTQGIDLFMFGSIARKENRPNSDLDLGIEWRRPASAKLFRELSKEVDDLPTVRKVDLVDFSKVSNSWKEIAGRDRIFLS